MAKDPAVLAHQEWLGYVQPVGLVVSIPALLDANARINQNFAPGHREFLDALPTDAKGETVPEVRDFPDFAHAVLGWEREDLYGAPGTPAIPESLEVPLLDYGETLSPTYALREFQPAENGPQWILLVKVLPTGTDFDRAQDADTRHWQASAQAKFERLLRQLRVPIGLLVNGREIRLVYAPDKELSGHITFKLAEMTALAGRPIFAAFQMLLSAERLYSVGERERLAGILENSRKYQNVVSTQLASQVLEALYELLRGFQAANDQTQGKLLREVLDIEPDLVYRGLLTTLLRLVFILYAEDRGLLSTDPVYTNYYSVTGLFERLKVDEGRYPDTMDQRYGAWAQLLTLFRLIYRGGSHGSLRIPAREGYLFDPDRYLFLEGRFRRTDGLDVPRVPDGVLFRVLSKLMLLDGERISYRTLAVEQIGSVYEAIMGFELHVARGPSIAIKSAKKHGAPTTINLEELLGVAPDDRPKWFQEASDQKLTGSTGDGLKQAKTIADLQATLAGKIAASVTPNLVAKGAMIFQPSDERRHSGSHYTPRSLTGPIVEAALGPVLKQLGDSPTPAQILNLKVCDPAMGSGAFLVEACRQLGDQLSKAWHAHGDLPVLPPDEDEALYAQRQIAQRCLYGVDRNPTATDLAKLSLWLGTLAKDHPFTFLDHSLRTGDSLVGLTRKQIAAFHWEPTAQLTDLEDRIRKKIDAVSNYRREIFDSRDDVPYATLLQKLDAAEDSLSLPRQIGDAVIAAFFAGQKAKERERQRTELLRELNVDLKEHGFIAVDGAIYVAIANIKAGPQGVRSFHWELEFPEVFTFDLNGDATGGFDVIVGNPPFAGKNTLIAANQKQYPDWLKAIHEESHGNADLVAHFFRRAFRLLRVGGCMGLIATNTVGQGDTRSTGLRWICTHEGTIYRAVKRLKWPGEGAAVVVSVVHICRGRMVAPFLLNGRAVDRITSYLFHEGGQEDPAALEPNADKSFQGSIILGMGFTFDDTDRDRVASSLAEMRSLIANNPHNAERIFPYMGGEELNNSPTHAHHRFVINFEDFPLERRSSGHSWFRLTEETQHRQLRDGIVAPDYPGPVATDWPDLIAIVRDKVKPVRDLDNREVRRREWWKFAEKALGLTSALKSLSFSFAISRIGNAFAFTRLPNQLVLNEKVVVFVSESFGFFAALQSRVHEVWARFFSSTLKDDLQYTPSTCFETFPFPISDSGLEHTGRAYYELRADLMVRNDEGLTKTYNRFHDPNDRSSDIARLRKLHDSMDLAVLEAYGWQDIQPVCEFFPEFGEDEAESGRPKRKKYRYRWPDEIHDEVLARLLDLNRQRALEEGQMHAPPERPDTPAPKPRRPSGKSPKKGGANGSHSLFATDEPDA